MAKRPNRGIEFEREILASMPPGVYARKLSTPAPPGYLANQAIDALKAAPGGVPPWVEGQLRRTSFPVKPPYDLIIVAPLATAPPQPLRLPDGSSLTLQPSLFIAVEVKSVGSSGTSLPFANVKEHQVEGLLKATGYGHLAGLLIDFPAAGVAGEAWFIPIQVYSAHLQRSERKSLSLDEARRMGLPIRPDLERGRVKKYWQMATFLRLCGASAGFIDEATP